MNFLNAALLLGLAAIAIPLIIHLFHKSRFKVVRWGAMHLLNSAVQTNRRRVKVEQWILLAIRCAIPALLALAMARPIWKGNSTLLGQARTSAVLVLDDSGSMGAAQGGESRWTVARDAARQVIQDLPDGSEAGVVFMAEGGDSPLTTDRARAAQSVAKVQEGFGIARVSAALNRAASMLEKAREPVRTVVMMSDFQRASFEPAETALLKATVERMRKMPFPPNIVFWDIGDDVRENFAIESLEAPKLAVGVGQKVQFRANLRNYGDVNHPSLRVVLKVDDVEKSVSEVNLAPRSTAQVLFSETFQSVGSHVIEVETEPDAFPQDNRYIASVPVWDRLPVLLVDGAPGSGGIESETAYLQVALSPFAAGNVQMSDLLESREVTLEGLDSKALDSCKVVVLANVRRLGDEQLKALEEFVNRGGGLLVFPGDQTELAWWNNTFSRLAPIPLHSIAGGLDTPGTNIQSERFEHQALQFFNEPANGSLAEGVLKVWWKMVPSSKATGDVAVLATLGNGDPFLAERKFGRGKVIACATACDSDWSNLPARPAYVPLMQRLVVYLASNAEPPRNLAPGDSLVAMLPREAAGKTAIVHPPFGAPVDVPVPVGDSRLEYGPVNTPGVYMVTPPGAPALHFAVNADRKESNLTKLSPDEMKELSASLDVPLVKSVGEYQSLEGRMRNGTELWKWALLGLLVFLFLELLAQQWFARAPRAVRKETA